MPDARRRAGGLATPASAEDPRFDPEDADAYVFAQPDGSPTHPQVLSDMFNKVVARSELPRIRLPDLRHTHATSLLKAGVPIKVVSERLRHWTPAFTMATYHHVLPGMHEEAARAFADLLEPPGFCPVEAPVEGRGRDTALAGATR